LILYALERYESLYGSHLEMKVESTIRGMYYIYIYQDILYKLKKSFIPEVRRARRRERAEREQRSWAFQHQ